LLIETSLYYDARSEKYQPSLLFPFQAFSDRPFQNITYSTCSSLCYVSLVYFFFVSVALFVVDGIKTRVGGTVQKPRFKFVGCFK